jgi:hypothetical protein
MDADDIAVNDRIEKQVHWLLHHPDTAAVGCFIKVINSTGNELPAWELDRKSHTHTAIRDVMPKENCLAHPTVMVRSGLFKHYRYAAYQKHIEDYDLWLRMLADGLVIEKVPQPLLLYRQHDASVTSNFLRNKNPFMKNYHCKRRFLANRIKSGKWGLFESKVSMMMIRDRLMAIAKTAKQQIQ